MLTKKQFALQIINDFAYGEDINPEDVHEGHITMSSSLAVAMEFLGKIQNPQLKAYASERGGTVSHYINEKDGKLIEQGILTVREVLSLLPETL